jgi:hypothetical protein
MLIVPAVSNCPSERKQRKQRRVSTLQSESYFYGVGLPLPDAKLTKLAELEFRKRGKSKPGLLTGLMSEPAPQQFGNDLETPKKCIFHYDRLLWLPTFGVVSLLMVAACDLIAWVLEHLRQSDADYFHGYILPIPNLGLLLSYQDSLAGIDKRFHWSVVGLLVLAVRLTTCIRLSFAIALWDWSIVGWLAGCHALLARSVMVHVVHLRRWTLRYLYPMFCIGWSPISVGGYSVL